MYSSHQDIEQALTQAARTPIMMLASDFDGCLAPIIKQPMAVAAQPKGIDALIELSQLPDTYGAIVSGRDLERLIPLAKRTGEHGTDVSNDSPDQVRDISSLILSGSHGAEANDGSAATPTVEQVELRNRIVAEAERIGARAQDQGMYIEPKPLGVVMHGAAMEDKKLEKQLQQEFAEILDDLFDGTEASYMFGKDIVEAQVLQIHKGMWLANARDRYNVGAIVYAGDDTTDENAFKVMSPPDVSIKIGDNETQAQLRVEKAQDIPDIYQMLLKLRKEFLAESGKL